LQVHSIGNPQEAGIEIRWRNFRIMTENLDVHSKISTAPIKHTSNE
jgi:hypothetical protein